MNFKKLLIPALIIGFILFLAIPANTNETDARNVIYNASYFR